MLIAEISMPTHCAFHTVAHEQGKATRAEVSWIIHANDLCSRLVGLLKVEET